MAKANKHLDHLEDRIILEGASGGAEAIKILKEMGDLLTGKPGVPISVTTKWDGAPAIVCGIDPEDGQFFVGTKSVFNTQDPKICKTQSDVMRMYDGALAQKLSTALRYLPSSVQSGILQGDLMFTDDKKSESIDGQRMITFRPNTITYAANPRTSLGRDIQTAQIGIVFHTKYTGSKMSDLTPSFMVNDTDFKTGGPVWAERATFTDMGGVANFALGEKQKYDAAVRKAEGSLRATRGFLNEIQTGKKARGVDTELLKFFNQYVRQGMEVPSVQKGYDDYILHMNNEFNNLYGKVKMQKTVSKKVEEWASMIYFLTKNKDKMKMVIAAYMNLTVAKNMLLGKLKRVSSLNLFVDKGGGDYEATTPEGFVAITGDRATKLVDRMEFSRLNFTLPKNW